MQTVTYQNPLIKKLYGADPREVPIYSISEVAQYIKVADNTLRSWVYGREYEVKGRLRKFKPIIKLPKTNQERLSFLNLVEAFTVSSLTRIERLSFGKVRSAIETLEKTFDTPHPLIDRDFWTDAVDLFTRDNHSIINLSRWGQIEMGHIIQVYLRRVERHDIDLSPVKVYPFSRELKLSIFKQKPETEAKSLLDKIPKYVEVDPLIAFGRPTITGTGIPVEVIASRRRAGETIRFIAKDYGIKEKEVREAIEYVRLKRVA